MTVAEAAMSGFNVVVLVVAALAVRGWVSKLRADHTAEIHKLRTDLTKQIHDLAIGLAESKGGSSSSHTAGHRGPA